jgi:cysteine desulfurase
MPQGNFCSTSKNDRPIYLDYQATTPLYPQVLDAMIPYFTEKFGNPHSRGHCFGWETEEAVEVARKRIAALIGASNKEIIFTSGATESNNLAIKGTSRLQKSNKYGKIKNHIITCVTDHDCVLESCAVLEQEGFEITYLPVSANGLINLNSLEDAINNKTILVSIMSVNNEIGVIQPLEDIGNICRKKGVFFHTDAAQAVGKIPIDVDEMSIDLLSISGHKTYGPKGIGALYIRRRPRVRLAALFSGGGQEQNLRSGTLAPPLCVGLGKAAEISALRIEKEAIRLTGLRERFLKKLLSSAGEVKINGDLIKRVPGNLNLSFPGVMADNLMAALNGLALSSGSACSSGSNQSSHVLKALGISDDLSAATIRIGFGCFTTDRDVDFAANSIAEEVYRQRTNPGYRAPAA